MIGGLSICFGVTAVNLFYFSIEFWIPVTFDTPEKKDKWGGIIIPTRTITTGEYKYDMDALAKNKTAAFAILGYGAVTSFIFIFIATIRSLGKTHFNLIINI